MAAVTTVAIRVECAHEIGVAHPQGAPIGVKWQVKRLERAALVGCYRSPIGPLGGTSRPIPRIDRVKRIGKIRPARRGINSGGGRKGAGVSVPTVHRVLRGKNLFGRHAGEPIVARVEFPNVVKAVPTILAGSIEPGSAFPRGPEFSGFGTTRYLAGASCAGVSSMESVVLHPFHMAIDRLEGKSCPVPSPMKSNPC